MSSGVPATMAASTATADQYVRRPLIACASLGPRLPPARLNLLRLAPRLTRFLPRGAGPSPCERMPRGALPMDMSLTDDEAADPGEPLRRLKWSVQALADSGSSQPPLFPDQATGADELASAFDQRLAAVRIEGTDQLTASQSASLD